MKEKNTTTVNLPKPIFNRVREIAVIEHRSTVQQIVKIIEEWFARIGKEEGR